MKAPLRTLLSGLLVVGAVTALLTSGCAGRRNTPATGGAGGFGGGTGGSGGGIVVQCMEGLTSIEVSPATQNIALQQDAAGIVGQATYTATGHFSDGRTEDVTSRVSWQSGFVTLQVSAGVAIATAPGTYTISAKCGNMTGQAQLVATFSGDFTGTGFTAGKEALDGNPSGSVQIAYPLDGALFPRNLGPIQVHVTKAAATQNVARLQFTGDGIDLKYYGNCEAGPGTGCYVSLPLSFTTLLVPASEQGDIQMTARVGGTSGAPAESAPIAVAWANVPLQGGLYYWSTIPAGVYAGYTAPAAPGTGIMRYNFDREGPVPELVYTDAGFPPTYGGSPPGNAPTDWGQCIGCHAISSDGKMMALSAGGSLDSGLVLMNLELAELLQTNPAASAPQNTGIEGLRRYVLPLTATMTSFGPPPTSGAIYRAVTMYQGQLSLRLIDTVGATAVATGLIGSSIAEFKTDPFWSTDGKYFAFTTFPDAAANVGPYNTTGTNSDMKVGGQVWIATSDGLTVNEDARIIAPRQAGVTSYYPAISNDSKLVVYNKSTCGAGVDVIKAATDYGNLKCDGYDDATATLWLTTTNTDPSNPMAVNLARANGDGVNSNSWPRWSPDSGMFRGRRLYWVAFSSRRAYGLQVNTAGLNPTTNKPQLWFAAVVMPDEFMGDDPSFPPVWLPAQNHNQATPQGNHVPQWVKVAVDIPG